MPISEPWHRVRIPMPIPDPLTVDHLAEMSTDDLAEFLRGNLIPADQTPEERVRWATLWRLLRDDDVLVDRAFDVLEDMLNTTNEALKSSRLPEAARKRARIFRGRCEDAWARLEDRDQDVRALAWAGEKAARFNPEARQVIATLVNAIHHHRASRSQTQSGDDIDTTLWRSLRQVGLDPRDSA